MDLVDARCRDGIASSAVVTAGAALRAAAAGARSSCGSELDREKVVAVSVTSAESFDDVTVENNVLPMSLFAIVSQAQRIVKLSA